MGLIQDESGKPAPKLKHYQFISEEEKAEVFGQVKEVSNLQFIVLISSFRS
jgi:hypothetical protein